MTIIIYTCNAISVLVLVPFIFITSDYHPVWIQNLPFPPMGGAGLVFLPLTLLWSVYYVIACAVEGQWKRFAYSLTGFVLIITASIVSIHVLSQISTRDADRIALTVLKKNSLGYTFHIDDDARDILKIFQSNYDKSAILRENALPQYGIYWYIVRPRSSPGFLMRINRYERTVNIYVQGFENHVKYRRVPFVKIE